MAKETQFERSTPEASNSFEPDTELPGAATDPDSQKLMEQLTKAFGQQSFPGVDTAAILETILQNMAVLSAANRHVFENAQAVMVRQGAILKQTLEGAAAVVDALANARNPQELAAAQGELLRRILLRTLHDMRREAETTLKSSSEAFAEAFTAINSRVIRNVQEITELIKQLEK
ncbi:MAG: phasin family protein [Gammaproteobacteria bacterium]